MADDYPKLLYLNMLGNNHFPVRTDTLNYFITFKLGQKYSSSCVKQKTWQQDFALYTPILWNL